MSEQWRESYDSWKTTAPRDDNPIMEPADDIDTLAQYHDYTCPVFRGYVEHEFVTACSCGLSDIVAQKLVMSPLPVSPPPQPTDWIEQRLRQEWWTGHGCSFASLYGDDGEMQCNALTCRKDFKRDSMESLRQHVEARRMAQYVEAQSSVVSPLPTQETK
jgi:hypothetical protein